MDATELDLDYVRRVGEEVRARLFPRPTGDGRLPVPLPVALDYRLGEDEDLEVLFVPERSIQRVDAPVPDVEPSHVRVIIPSPLDTAFATDLEFGQEPSFAFGSNGATDEEKALAALLRAVAGVL